MSINISAADVNKLRGLTGAGMMDCKKALTESEGDYEKAIDILRKKGQKVASNRADKEATEGVVLGRISNDCKRAVIVRVSCETDFVAKNDSFVAFVKSILDEAVCAKPLTIDDLKNCKIEGLTIAERLDEQIGKIGEKIELSKYEVVEAAKVFAYNHPGNRLSTIVGFNMDNAANIDQVGKEIAMQIAAMSPIAIDKDDVDASVLEREIDIAKEQARNEGKPEAMLEKIAIGKLNKFYNESTLLNQEFVRDNKKTIRQYLTETNPELKVTSFRRISVG